VRRCGEVGRAPTEARAAASQHGAAAVHLNTERGEAMTRQAFWTLIERLALVAGLRVVPMLLGHGDLQPTQIWTHVARKALKELHEKHPPRGSSAVR
jgi:integrase/recombinase XerD